MVVRRLADAAGFGDDAGSRQVCAAGFGEMCVFVSMLPSLLEGHGLTGFGPAGLCRWARGWSSAGRSAC